MKKCVLIFMSLVFLLSGCGIIAEKPEVTPAPEAESQFVFTRENFPVVEGGAALEPLAESVASVMLGESRESVADLLDFGNTGQSYENLMAGRCGLVLAAEPSQAVMELMVSDSPCALAPVARDGLVFFVSQSNPVDNLTVDEILKIYTGKYDSWSDVSGDDVPIKAFTRGEWSGSRAAMDNLVMSGAEFAAPAADASESVFDGSEGAIGYSLYHYADIMRMAGDYKILTVEGVRPSNETIASGEYPLVANYCAAISAEAEEDSPERILWAWLQGAEGQKFIALQGYVPAQ